MVICVVLSVIGFILPRNRITFERQRVSSVESEMMREEWQYVGSVVTVMGAPEQVMILVSKPDTGAVTQPGVTRQHQVRQ